MKGLGGDIKSARLIYLKGGLFLLLGVLCAALLLLEHFSLRTLALLLICIWAFCRFYYFVFYVIQHYVDPGYRFSGLFDFLRYLARRKRMESVERKTDKT